MSPWILVFVVLLYVLVCVTGKVHERFANPTDATTPKKDDPNITAEFKKSYAAFLAIYVPFMVNWQKAVVTAIGLERPAPAEGSTFVPPSVEEMNQYLSILQQKQQRAYPLVAPEVGTWTPETVPSVDVMLRVVPEDPKTVVHAVEWMNQQLAEAMKALPTTTAEHFMDVEGFANGQCQDLEACLENDPDFLDRLEAARDAQRAKKQQSVRVTIQKRMDAIVGDSELVAGLKKNTELVARSAEIQKQATSGQLMSSVAGAIGSASDEPPSQPYVLPPGAGKSFDPNAYKDMKSLLGLKSSLDQINRGLR